jgi:hypothetical protein
MCMFCVDFDASGFQLIIAPQNTSRKARKNVYFFFVFRALL